MSDRWGALLLLVLVSPLAAQPPVVKEVYQDFRNKRPLGEAFRMRGPDLENEVTAEEEGLRITLPAERPHHWAVEVGNNISLTGDFEITGTYELLSAKQPAKGYGSGVNLSVADSEKRKKFAKVSRVMRPKEGSVHFVESWAPYRAIAKPSEAKSGQLRLVRIGPVLHYLVSDGPGQEFREVSLQKNFGAEDIEHFGFGVTDSGEPGNPVDARLIDLRIRVGTITPDKALDPAPLVAPAPAPPPPPAPAVPPPRPQGSMVWLVAVLVGGLVLTLLVGVAAWLVLRRRPAATAATVVCPGCGKTLKVKAGLAGKKVKCSKCSKTVLVPNDADSA